MIRTTSFQYDVQWAAQPRPGIAILKLEAGLLINKNWFSIADARALQVAISNAISTVLEEDE